MTITAYQVNSVLSAYTRQSKVKITPAITQGEGSDGQYRDIVSLSTTEANKTEELDKISYNLRDVILNNENI